MDIIAPFGRSIPDTIGPSFQAYGDLLRQSSISAAILAADRQTFKYGTEERQMLDLYTPSAQAPAPASGESRPVLVFAYGGAFVSGDRVIAAVPGELVYKNLGYFFAEKLGFETIVIDYRLLSHGSKFPGGGEDVGGVMEWVERRYGSGANGTRKRTNVFVMGNSAGGVHVATWLFGKQFSGKREAIVKGRNGVKLSGVILLGCPLRWDMNGGMREMLTVYYGGEKETIENEPTALMEKATAGKDNVEAWPALLIAVSELDPEDHMIVPGKEFVKLWKQRGGKARFLELPGHNHLSPPLSLGTGIEREEAWGFEVGRWITEVIN